MSPSLKERVLERLSFEAFYRGELSNPKPTSQDYYQALCPFHEDHNPSLSVNFKTGLYRCFACGDQGDVFDFYMRRHGVDFKEALAALRELSGISEKTSEFQALSIKEFALSKKFPMDFLEIHGVRKSNFYGLADGVGFPYFKDADRKKVDYFRFRFASPKPNKFRTRKGDKPNFYGLWRLEEIKAAGWCLLVEGESDALTCWLHGLPALGLPGKENWTGCWERAPAGAKKLLSQIPVYLWEEPDAAEHPKNSPRALLLREQVARDLPGVKTIKAAAAGAKDLSEAHCKGEDIPKLVARLKKEARPEPRPASGDFPLHDYGNAMRLVALHGPDLRYCQPQKKWYVWTGSYWQVDSTLEVHRRATTVIDAILREAAKCQDLKEREARMKFAVATGDHRRHMAMIHMAQSEAGIPVLPEEFDTHPMLLNVANGTIDLTTGELHPHRREEMLTRMALVDYDPDAECPAWESFLYQIMDVDQRPEAADRLVYYLRSALGYALTGSTKEQCLFILWGDGSNGKTTLLNIIKQILGNYALTTPSETLLAKNRSSNIPNDVARLDGPRLVTASEVDRGRHLAQSLLKELVGGDSVSARFLHGEFFDFRPQFKLFISTNNKPVIRGSDHALFRRVRLIPFQVRFGDGFDFPKDEDMEEKLTRELPGILAWMVRGGLAWQEEGLQDPPEVTAALNDYRTEMDVLADFIEDRCMVAPELTVTSAEIYKSYCAWADESGLKEKERLKERALMMELRGRGFQSDRKSSYRFWRGVGLRVID